VLITKARIRPQQQVIAPRRRLVQSPLRPPAKPSRYVGKGAVIALGLNMLSIGDIVTLAGRPSDVFFTYGGRDQERERVPQEWGVFLSCDADRWNDQLTTLASATVICSPLWTVGMKCQWLGCDCEVSSITPDHVYVERESYVSPIPLAQITAANVNLFLTKEHNHGIIDKETQKAQ
jgi:hypothetical protein